MLRVLADTGMNARSELAMLQLAAHLAAWQPRNRR